MKRFAILVVSISALAVMVPGRANAQGQKLKQRVKHRVHQHVKHHVQKHGVRHHHHVYRAGKPRYVAPIRVVHRPVVQVPRVVVPGPIFYGPGHANYHQRFHTLVLKGQLPLQVKWTNGRYWIFFQGQWIGYDSFVQHHCLGNWDWYLAKYRSRYGF